MSYHPMFMEAEIAYRRDRYVRGPSRWDAERPHPVRAVLLRRLRALSAVHRGGGGGVRARTPEQALSGLRPPGARRLLRDRCEQ